MRPEYRAACCSGGICPRNFRVLADSNLPGRSALPQLLRTGHVSRAAEDTPGAGRGCRQSTFGCTQGLATGCTVTFCDEVSGEIGTISADLYGRRLESGPATATQSWCYARRRTGYDSAGFPWGSGVDGIKGTTLTAGSCRWHAASEAPARAAWDLLRERVS